MSDFRGFQKAASVFLASVLLSGAPARAEDALSELMKKYGSAEGPTAKSESPSAQKPADQAGSKEKRVKRHHEPSHGAKTVSRPTSDEAVAGPTRYTVQLASYAEATDADARIQKLSEAGVSATRSEAVIQGKTWYRVNVGEFTRRREADDYIRNQLESSLRSVAVVANIASPSLGSDRQPASVTEAKPAHPRKQEREVEPAKVAAPESETSGEAIATEEKSEEPSGLLGDWGGAKSAMKKVGIDVALKYKGDLVQNMGGGIERKADYLGQVDLTTDFDLQTLVGLRGLNLVLYGLGDHGGHPTEYVGDSYATSSIEGPSTFKLYEAYLKQTIDDRLTLLFGLRDLNADYYANPSAGVFVNSAFGIGPSFSQTDGPSIFPATALALSARYESPNSFYFQSGVFNARAGNQDKPYGTHVNTSSDYGYLFIWETGFAQESEASTFKYGLGVWSYSDPSDPIDPTGVARTNSGAYIIADQSLCESISVFVKHGVASPKINSFSSSTETGLNIKGLIPGRDDDVLGLGYARTSTSDDERSINGSEREEAIIELSYQLEFGRGIALTPDFQYVLNPGAASGVKDAQVGTLRVQVEF